MYCEVVVKSAFLSVSRLTISHQEYLSSRPDEVLDLPYT